jgi:uncharacterized membrane protein YphA (DoxX/SURF4 family)
MQEVALVARIVLGTVFLTSAMAKMRLSPAFVQAIWQYGLGLIGPRLARIAARLLPPFEFILGLLLLTGLWLKVTALALVGLLLIFTLSMMVNLSRGHRFRCNCFGAASSDIGVGSLSRNAVLMVAGILLAVVSRWSPSGVGSLRADGQLLATPATIALLMAGISVYTMLLAIGEIDSLFYPSGAR